MPTALSRVQMPRMKPLEFASRAAITSLFVLGIAAPSVTPSDVAMAQASTVSFTTAAAAPADSLSYIVTTLDDQSEQWRLADTLLDRAGFGEAIDKAVAEEMKDEAGQDLPLDAFLGGEVGIVLTEVAIDTLTEESMGSSDFDEMLGGMETEEMEESEPAAPEAQGFAVVLDARAPDTAWAGIRESVQESANEESTYEGTTILYAPPASDEDEGMATAKVGDLILIGTAPDDLHPLIDTLDGRTDDITTLPEFTTARDSLPAEFLMFAFVNSIENLDVDFGPLGPAAEGLATDAYSAMTIAADEPGFRMESVVLPADGETLPPIAAHYESELVTEAPDNTILFLSAPDLGATGVLDALGAALIGLAFGMGGAGMDEATPAADVSPEEYIAQQYEEAAALIGINLQTELFQQMVGEYGGWLSADMESQQVSGLFASHVADSETVSNALMQLSFMIQGASGAESPLTTRQVGDGQVYVIELEDEADSTLEFGVVGDQLVIGSSDAVDRLGGEAGSSLAENTQFQAVMDTLPVEGNGSFYIDLAQAIPLMEAASEEADDFDMGGFAEIEDSSESCASYAKQEEAQAAYDAAEPDTFDLDQDFDGEVCEDFFATDEPAVEEDTSDADIEEAFANVDYSAIKAFASVSYDDNGLNRSASILYISE